MIFKLAIPAVVFCLTTLYPVFYVEPDKNPLTSGKDNMTGPSVDLLYKRLGESDLPLAALKSSVNIYKRLTKEGQITNGNVITIINFNKPSHLNRLFVIDLASEKILYKSLVAHGKNSGEYYATSFSNVLNSHRSSLGFYLTGEPYMGRHGYSLMLDGLEKGINDNAKKKAVVIHGAAYVSPDYIALNGRLGRSFGCPALPLEIVSDIIDTIQGKSLFFIYCNDENYCKNSKFFNSFLSSP